MPPTTFYGNRKQPLRSGTFFPMFLAGTVLNRVHHKHRKLHDLQSTLRSARCCGTLGDSGFLQFFRVVSRDYGKPRCLVFFFSRNPGDGLWVQNAWGNKKNDRFELPSLKLTARAHENPPSFLVFIPSKWWIFHGDLLVYRRVGIIRLDL